VSEPPDPFPAYYAALEARHRAELTFAEVRRALQALSSLYVERREGIAAGKGIVIEATTTFFLVFAVFGTAVDPRGPWSKTAGLTIGLVQQMSTLILPYQLQNTAIFVVFLLIIFLRPQGMFGRLSERT